MRVIELNRPAVWSAINNEDISIRVYASNYRYLSRSKIILEATNEKPVYRYAKNFTTGKDKFSLLIISDEKDVKKIEKYLKSVANKLDVKNIRGSLVKSASFTYLDEYYKGDK